MGGAKLPFKRIRELKRIQSVHKHKKPLWRGPYKDGITQSMLSLFLACPERFRVMAMEGLVPIGEFNTRTEYGNMWHICEEHFAAGKLWDGVLKEYATEVAKVHPEAREELEKWYNVCKVQFSIYTRYWEEHKDVVNRVPLLQECAFEVPYKLPSGRTVLLRGKWDSVDLIENGIWLQENKTRGNPDELKIKNELPNDLQTNVYLTALDESIKQNIAQYDVQFTDIFSEEKRTLAKGPPPIKGVRYNVVRRPVSGGKFSISQLKGRLVNKRIYGKVVKGPDGPVKERVGAETPKQFYGRLGNLIEENADQFFMRFKCGIVRSDLKNFQQQSLNPILENLCDWWEWLSWCAERDAPVCNDSVHRQMFPQHTCRHFRMPYGVWNPIFEDRIDGYNGYVTTGSTAGLRRLDKLFGELV